ncbi:MAG: cytochrome c oxidase assembly protein [Rhodospirillaceae bacterium]|jgi:cytochrome c oxidase assembly protein subunit 11|nr:cytochrome c oxidase assembly protein [Rhodospirillaceae bacterium]MBT4044590.1 cytochrome c oxidase assembly protein [Rhodospirillaceae bacterium]MBT4686897.1 cytochrome c oxidase assembly protein [Rhodospirillaceae bacterium]MBT5081857.1 cytochrome c oxidase assembly protein [Rhodospirillaceae bacterium]MBT5524905.1 cytochrome c oxidase assembly protein [Rhodospirillaceae bacterium]
MDRQLRNPGTGRNRLTALVAAGVVFTMIGAAYAAVPLYQIFCQVTGFGGTTQVAEEAPAEIGERIITVRFNADTARNMPWKFSPQQRAVTLHVGEQTLAFYQASNPTDRAIVGSSTFNVTPAKAGAYFNKIECFCFTEQVLVPGQSVDMPVSFFVDPAISDDPNLDDVKTITLSYTFFEVAGSSNDTETTKKIAAN